MMAGDPRHPAESAQLAGLAAVSWSPKGSRSCKSKTLGVTCLGTRIAKEKVWGGDNASVSVSVSNLDLSSSRPLGFHIPFMISHQSFF